MSKNDRFTELVIACSDTDVCLIMLNYFEDCKIFKTSHKEYYLREIHRRLKAGIIKALLGFHSFSGDQTEKFHGYSKKSCWQTLLHSPDVLDMSLADWETMNARVKQI